MIRCRKAVDPRVVAECFNRLIQRAALPLQGVGNIASWAHRLIKGGSEIECSRGRSSAAVFRAHAGVVAFSKADRALVIEDANLWRIARTVGAERITCTVITAVHEEMRVAAGGAGHPIVAD